MKKWTWVLVLLAGCSDSENSSSTLVEVGQSALNYTYSARFSGKLMVVDGAVFSLEGKNTKAWAQ